eukprot:7897-Eustigmatos_ZCMA.PRE.1
MSLKLHRSTKKHTITDAPCCLVGHVVAYWLWAEGAGIHAVGIKLDASTQALSEGSQPDEAVRQSRPFRRQCRACLVKHECNG